MGAKTAALSQIPRGVSVTDFAREQARQQAIQGMYHNAARYGLSAAGIGAALAGLRRLGSLRTEQKVDQEESAQQGQSIRIRPKTASIKKTVSDIFTGTQAVQPRDVPVAWPLAGAAIVGGGLLGYKGTDAVMRYMRDRAAKAEIARAQQEYEQALFHAGKPSKTKQAGQVSEFAQNVSRIVDVLEKVANESYLSPSASRLGSNAAGLYMLMLAAGMGIGGHAGYTHAKRNSKEKAVERAHKERQLADYRPVSHVPVLYTPQANNQ